jgi:hypothetical protein
MRQRGRKSATRLAINNVDGSPPRLVLPAGLNAKERALFEQVVNATDPGHFRKGDVPMLIAFVQASLLSRALGRDSSQIKEWERATRTLASLATRLRLTPHSRTRPETIARQQQPAAGSWNKVPWESETEEEPWADELPQDDDKLQ